MTVASKVGCPEEVDILKLYLGNFKYLMMWCMRRMAVHVSRCRRRLGRLRVAITRGVWAGISVRWRLWVKVTHYLFKL